MIKQQLNLRLLLCSHRASPSEVDSQSVRRAATTRDGVDA